MKHWILVGAVMFAGVAGWASAQTGRPQSAPALRAVSIDQTAVLAARVQELQNRVQTLETANETQGSTILMLMAFRTTANGAITDVTQKQAALLQQQAALQQRFDTHTHGYTYPNLVWHNRNFVTESHVSGDEKDLASYISVFTPLQQTTGVPK